MYVVDGLHFLMEPGELCDYFTQASQSIKEYKDVNNLQRHFIVISYVQPYKGVSA